MKLVQKKKKKKVGRPAYKTKPKDRAQVKTMVGYGIPLADIASVLSICTNTLNRHFKDEIATGKTFANTQVAQALFKNAIGTPLETKDDKGRVISKQERPGNVVAQIFWMKCQAGWVDRVDDSKPLGHNTEPAKVTFYIPSNGREERQPLTDEQVREIEAVKKLNDMEGKAI
jgi:hypothetical protein